MMQPSDSLTITLTVVEWNQIMAMLGEQKYTLVAGLIAKINEQAQAANPGPPNGPELGLQGDQ